MFFDWFKTEYERKRDNYYRLYQRLQDALSDHDRKVNEAQQAYSSYKNSSPYLSSYRIPSNDFSPKLTEIEGRLMKRFDYEKRKRSELVTASSQAYQRYIHYKNLAIREAQEKNK